MDRISKPFKGLHTIPELAEIIGNGMSAKKLRIFTRLGMKIGNTTIKMDRWIVGHRGHGSLQSTMASWLKFVEDVRQAWIKVSLDQEQIDIARLDYPNYHNPFYNS